MYGVLRVRCHLVASFVIGHDHDDRRYVPERFSDDAATLIAGGGYA